MLKNSRKTFTLKIFEKTILHLKIQKSYKIALGYFVAFLYLINFSIALSETVGN